MRWECPNCDGWLVSPLNRMHYCTGLHGLAAYFVPAGTRAKTEAREREDYLNGDRVTLTEGRPIMATVTTREDGEDCIVFAPTAVANIGADAMARLQARAGL